MSYKKLKKVHIYKAKCKLCRLNKHSGEWNEIIDRYVVIFWGLKKKFNIATSNELLRDDVELIKKFGKK